MRSRGEGADRVKMRGGKEYKRMKREMRGEEGVGERRRAEEDV